MVWEPAEYTWGRGLKQPPLLVSGLPMVTPGQPFCVTNFGAEGIHLMALMRYEYGLIESVAGRTKGAAHRMKASNGAGQAWSSTLRWTLRCIRGPAFC